MTTSSATPAGHGAGYTVLVVDDDPRIVELLQIALGAHGYRVLTANNGEDALKLSFQEQPDLVLLDVKLPRRSGYDVCQSIRREPELAHLPVIMISALSDTEARLQGLERGADDYLPKPFSPKELLAKARRAIERAERFKQMERRQRELVGEMDRMREELRRSHQDRRREQRVREATNQLTQQLSRLSRAEEVSSHFLFALMTHLGSQVAVLLEPREEQGGRLLPTLSRGVDTPQETALWFDPDGELARILLALSRPTRREELERFPELRDELAPLFPAGIAVLVPVVARGRLVALALLGDKAEPSPYASLDIEMATHLGQAAGLALEQGHLVRRAHQTYERALRVFLTTVGERNPEAAVRAEAVQAVTEALAREIGFTASSSRRLGLETAALAMQEGTGERWEGVSGITPITESGLEGEVAAVARDFVELAPRIEVGLGARQVVAHLRGDRQVLQGLEDLLTRGDLIPADLTVRREETEEPAA